MEVKILDIQNLVHHTKKFTLEKPKDFHYSAGQHIVLSIPNTHHPKRAYSFASIPSEENLEFLIKIYPENNGLTKELDKLKTGDSLHLGPVFGDGSYISEGNFIASGVGVTTFVSIFKDLKEKNIDISNNKLFYSSRTEDDLIMEDWLDKIVNLYLIITRNPDTKHHKGRLDKEKIKKLCDLDKPFYVCGSIAFNSNMKSILTNIGIKEDKIIVF